MLVNIIQNTISSFRSALAAAEVITTNLKMWLGFETSETLGREEITNGDFATDSDWNKNSNWSISGGVAIADGTTNGDINQGTTLATIGNSYSITYEVVSISQGSFFFKFGGVSGAFRDEIGIYTEVIQAINTNRIALDSLNNAIGSVTNISVREVTQITPDKSGNNNVGELFTGKALEFDGNGDYVDVDGFQMTGTNATFAFWFNSNDTLGRFFDTVKDTSDNRLILSFHNNQISILDHSVSWFNFGSITTSVWNRCVITIKGTTAKCFVNGVQLGVDKTISTIDLSLNTKAAIGSHFAGTQSYFDGSLSDFQVYDKVWFTDDIAYDYANPQNLVTDRDGTSIGLSNLKGYWHLSEGAGSLVYDSSGEDNNGTINGATYEPAQPRIPQLGMMNWSKGSNLLTYSEDFSQSVWTKNQLTQVYGFTSPTGQLNATKLTATNTDPYILFTLSGVSTDRTYSASAYIKGTASTIGEDVRLWIIKDSSVFHSQDFTLTSDWQRISTTKTFTSDVSTSILFRLDTPDTNPGVSDEVFVWATQLENSSSASAYRLTDGAATLNSTVIPNPTIPTQDIFGNAVRDRLNSFNLDGSGYSSVANNSSIKPTSALSIECWIKTPDVSSASKYISDADVGATRFFLMQVGSKARFKIATTEIDSAANLTDNTWHYIAGTWNGSTMTLYVDEETPVTISKSGAITYDTDDLFIGSRLGTGEYFDGLISDVRLYDRALTSDEVENNYNAGLSAHTND